jgi:hypothetical protein
LRPVASIRKRWRGFKSLSTDSETERVPEIELFGIIIGIGQRQGSATRLVGLVNQSL